MIDSTRLRSFVAFAEARSFTRAAQVLHVSQPALFVQIQKLADELDVQLYRRAGRGVELTGAGLALLAHGRESLERDQAFSASLHDAVATEPLSLAAGEGTFLHLLGPAVRAYAGRDAGRLRLVTRDRDGTMDAVRSGEAHVGVAPVDETPDGLRAERWAEVGVVVALPRRHPLARRRSLVLRDLAGASLVVPPQGRPLRATLATALAAARVEWRCGAEATGWDVLLQFASLGYGLAVVNAFCRMPRGLVARPLAGLPPLVYRLLTRSGRASTPRLASLLAALREHRWHG